MVAASVSIVRTVTLTNNTGFPGAVKEVICTFTPSTSYPALGEPMTASLFGLAEIDDVVPRAPSDGSRIVTYDPVNDSLRIYTALNTEAGTGTDQSAKVCPLVVLGR